MDTQRKAIRLGCFTISAAVAVILFLDVAIPSAQEVVDGPPDGIEVLARGPVHEAFAEPVVFDPTPGAVVSAEPPAPIDEVPNEQKLEGEHVGWIPGYWAWDLDRKNFIWVSGFWRTLPPGRQWVPGYWMSSDGSSRWISGFWTAADDDEIEYLATPPQTLEQGPSTPAPSVNHFWVGGCWYWRDARYVWRPGYWTPFQTDWIWVPAHYVWTPQGCIFVAGYWDHALPQRGLLFAPVYFHRQIYRQPSFFYTPRLCIDVTLLTNHFFVSTGYQHYYFGDYYQASYFNSGFQPWYAFHNQRGGYDPIFVYNRHQHRNDRDWEQNLHRDYEHRRDHEDARPPRTVTALTALGNGDRGHDRNIQNASLVKSVENLSANPDAKIRVRKIEGQHRDEITQRAKESAHFAEQRRDLEKKHSAGGLAAAEEPIAEGKKEKPGVDGAKDKPVVDGEKDKPAVEGRRARVALPKSLVTVPSTVQGKSNGKDDAKSSAGSGSKKELNPAQKVTGNVDKGRSERRSKVTEDDPPKGSSKQTFKGNEAPAQTSKPPKLDSGPKPKSDPSPRPKQEIDRPSKSEPRPAPKVESAPRRKEESNRPSKPDKPDSDRPSKKEDKGKNK